MAELLAMALASNQTKVFNMVFSDSVSSLRRPGDSMIHHQRTHEEPIDEKLGYQPISTGFVERSMQGWATFLTILAGIREGDGTLLDNCLVFAHSDTQFAKVHSINGSPCMTAGRAGGRLRTGLRVAGHGDAIPRVGLTLQQGRNHWLTLWAHSLPAFGRRCARMLKNEFASSRILVVGRNAATTVEIERGLQSHGHEVVGIATSCARALELAEIHEPELVLVDDSADSDEIDLTVTRLRQQFRMPCIRVRPPQAAARPLSEAA